MTNATHIRYSLARTPRSVESKPLLLGQLFQSNAVSTLGFVEEALPFTDVIPTATLAWVLETFFADTG